jgi:hypothetical protein
MKDKLYNFSVYLMFFLLGFIGATIMIVSLA